MEPYHLDLSKLPGPLEHRIRYLPDHYGTAPVATERGLVYRGDCLAQVGARMGSRPGLRLELEAGAVLDAKRVSVHQHLLRVLASLLGDVGRYDAVRLALVGRQLSLVRLDAEGNAGPMAEWYVWPEGAVTFGDKARPCPALLDAPCGDDFIPTALCRLLEVHADLAVAQPRSTP